MIIIFITFSSEPSRAALISARVYLSLMRFPTPNLPPDQPVLTNQTFTLLVSILPINILAYLAGCNGINGAPKQAENSGLGSNTPSSVPATFAV